MGLFDIFRRKNRKNKEEQEKKAAQSENAASQSVASSAEQVAASENSEVASSATVGNVNARESSEAESISTATAEVKSAQSEEPQAPVSEDSTSAQDLNSAEEAASESTEAEHENEQSEESSSTPEEGSEDSSEKETASSGENQATADQAINATSDTETEEPQDDESEPEENASEQKYDSGLAKSRSGFGARLNKFLANFRHVDEDFFEDLEDMMIESDVGYDMAMKLSDSLREEVKLQNAKSKQDVSNVIIQKMVELYDEAGNGENNGINFAKSGPTVIMFVGVNGAGKTTTIGKMAARYKKQGKKVLLAAADTFRAGATEQLDVWAKRDGVDIVTGPENGDPAAVVFDAVKKAKADNYDILFVDTAGRLQNKVNLMNELAKMKRILTREIPDAPHEVLLVLDATTGQNALTQAKLFKESTDVTGIVLTKLDGTARGGIVLAIRNELHLPVKFVGLGEKVDDLQEFNAGDFVYGLFKGLVTTD